MNQPPTDGWLCVYNQRVKGTASHALVFRCDTHILTGNLHQTDAKAYTPKEIYTLRFTDFSSRTIKERVI